VRKTGNKLEEKEKKTQVGKDQGKEKINPIMYCDAVGSFLNDTRTNV
jgi:hypothetical protein